MTALLERFGVERQAWWALATMFLLGCPDTTLRYGRECLDGPRLDLITACWRLREICATGVDSVQGASAHFQCSMAPTVAQCQAYLQPISTSSVAAATDVGCLMQNGFRGDFNACANLCEEARRRPDVRPRDATSDVAVDVRAEAGDAATNVIGNPCASDTECGGGGRCRDFYPGGSCSRACTTDRQCGASAVCAGGTLGCVRECADSSECRSAESCLQVNSTGFILGCLPSCYAVPPAGTDTCPMGTTCDPNVGFCLAMPNPGAAVGAECASDEACASGRCITEINDMGMPSGFLGGYCISVGRASDAFMPMAPVPQSSCPMGAAVLPPDMGTVEGDPQVCLKVCGVDTDCRSGMHCERLTFTMPEGAMTSNGYCLPINCIDADHVSLPNGGCPIEATCRVTGTGTTMTGTCARTTMIDGGATDASEGGG